MTRTAGLIDDLIIRIEHFVRALFVPAEWCRSVLIVLFLLTSTQKGECADHENSRGQRVFTQQCARCHGDKGQGESATPQTTAPSLRAEHEYGKVMTAVEVGPASMPSFVHILSIADIRVVSHFVSERIADIPQRKGDVGIGGVLYRTYCASCHRTDGRGGALAFAGINAPDLMDKSPARIAGAMRWGPGPMPAFPESVLDDTQLASIVEYVQSLQNLPSPGGKPLAWYGPVSEGFVAWGIVSGLIFLAAWIEKGGQG